MGHYNPYNNGGVIKRDDQFINRTVLVKKVLNTLFANVAQCQSIVGQAKIGKSSLVEHFFDPTTMREFDFDGSNHLFLYVNCSMHSSALKSPEDFYRVLLHRLLVRKPETLLDVVGVYPANHSWQDVWEYVLLELAERHLYLILFLDEFDKAILYSTLLKDGLFDSLRAYGSTFDYFAWVTCTLQPLHRQFEQAFRKFGISDEERMSFSEFYNIVSRSHSVELFNQEDIDMLITSPAETEQIIFTREEQQIIRDFGGRFPYFIQCACYHFFEAHVKKEVVQLQDIQQECMKGALPLWTDYWNKLTPQQQMLLFSIASDHLLPPSPTTQALLQSLKEAALIYEEYGHWFPFSQNFGAFVRSREHPYVGFPVNPGQHLWNQYEVEVIAERTWHSQVVKARHLLLQQHRAIKLLCINQDHSDKQIKDFQDKLLREAKILVSLQHKNIGKVHDVRSEPLGVIMEWIEGKSLHQVLAEHMCLPPVIIVKIGLHMAEALHYVHKKGIVHRDIKPYNIILTADDEPILIDFDVAHSDYQHTVTQDENGAVIQVGTFDYSAPEQFMRKDQVGPPADIFALGAVIYELLTLERPYPYGNNPKDYPDQLLPPPEPQNIPEPLYQLLCAMLHQNPEQRLNALAVHTAFQEYFITLESTSKKEKAV